MFNHLTRKFLGCTLLACLCMIGLLASQVYAQKNQILKLGRGFKLPHKFDFPIAPVPPLLPHVKVETALTNASGLPINPKEAKHSIVPSAITILGSDKIQSSGLLKNIHPPMPPTSYIAARERIQWKNLRNTFTTLAYYKPLPISALKQHLRHPVPEETFQYIQNQYMELIPKIQKTVKKTMPTIVYASLPGEGTRPTPKEVGDYSTAIYSLIRQIRELRTSLQNEPFLEKQQAAWEQAFATFNPLLAGVITSPGKEINRKDRRQLNTREFNLYNPDGTDYLLPRSETLLVDPDEMDEIESYAAVREKMRNPPIKPEDAAAERTALLNQLPPNMRIALINDDTLPRVNFQAWAKKGYLGHNATIETFPDGNGFMDQVRHGVRYDLVITDLLVPHGGIAMMPELRALDTSMPVIVSSKFDRGDEDEEKLFKLGFDGYLWYNTNLN